MGQIDTTEISQVSNVDWYFIFKVASIIVSALTVAIVWLALYIRSLHKISTERFINVIIDHAKSNEHLASSIDDLPTKIVEKLVVNGYGKKR